jgi:hypothetical protein
MDGKLALLYFIVIAMVMFFMPTTKTSKALSTLFPLWQWREFRLRQNNFWASS